MPCVVTPLYVHSHSHHHTRWWRWRWAAAAGTGSGEGEGGGGGGARMSHAPPAYPTPYCTPPPPPSSRVLKKIRPLMQARGLAWRRSCASEIQGSLRSRRSRQHLEANAGSRRRVFPWPEKVWRARGAHACSEEEGYARRRLPTLHVQLQKQLCRRTP